MTEMVWPQIETKNTSAFRFRYIEVAEDKIITDILCSRVKVITWRGVDNHSLIAASTH